MQQHPEQDDIPALALGALDPSEALHINTHLAQCPACRAETAAYRAVVGLLCYTIPPQEPPARLRERILSRIAVEIELCAATSG